MSDVSPPHRTGAPPKPIVRRCCEDERRSTLPVCGLLVGEVRYRRGLRGSLRTMERAMSRVEAQVRALARVCRGVQSRHFIDACCIAASRTGLDVLAALGMRKVRPLLVVTVACNRHLLDGLCEPPAAYIMTDWQTPRPGGLAGHLVLVGKVGSQRLLVDLSAYQMDRPARGIHVEGGIVALVDKPIGVRDPLEVTLSEGGRLYYSLHPDPLRAPWQRSPNWTIPTSEHRAAFATVAAELLEATAREETLHASP